MSLQFLQWVVMRACHPPWLGRSSRPEGTWESAGGPEGGAGRMAGQLYPVGVRGVTAAFWVRGEQRELWTLRSGPAATPPGAPVPVTQG